MGLYPVIQDWITGLPEIPYRNGAGAWEGVVMHYTDNPTDTARMERNYEGGHFKEAFVHEFIDPNEIIQVANPAYIAYGAGPKANPRFIHLELCSAQTWDEFNRSFDRWCQRAAFFLFSRRLGVTTAQSNGNGTLWSHYQVTQLLGGTTHEDPIAYLAKWGVSWDNVVIRVEQYYTRMVNGEMADKKTNFSDVEAGRWSENVIATVASLGLMAGYSDGTFRPAQSVTREELAKVLNDVIYYVNSKK